MMASVGSLLAACSLTRAVPVLFEQPHAPALHEQSRPELRQGAPGRPRPPGSAAPLPGPGCRRARRRTARAGHASGRAAHVGSRNRLAAPGAGRHRRQSIRRHATRMQSSPPRVCNGACWTKPARRAWQNAACTSLLAASPCRGRTRSERCAHARQHPRNPLPRSDRR